MYTMTDFSVLHDQRLILALAGGLAVLLATFLVYGAMWRPREDEEQGTRQPITGIGSFFSWLIKVVPWVLLLTFISTLAYTVTHVWMAAVHPPNW